MPSGTLLLLYFYIIDLITSGSKISSNPYLRIYAPLYLCMEKESSS